MKRLLSFFFTGLTTILSLATANSLAAAPALRPKTVATSYNFNERECSSERTCTIVSTSNTCTIYIYTDGTTGCGDTSG